MYYDSSLSLKKGKVYVPLMVSSGDLEKKVIVPSIWSLLMP